MVVVCFLAAVAFWLMVFAIPLGLLAGIAVWITHIYRREMFAPVAEFCESPVVTERERRWIYNQIDTSADIGPTIYQLGLKSRTDFNLIDTAVRYHYAVWKRRSRA